MSLAWVVGGYLWMVGEAVLVLKRERIAAFQVHARVLACGGISILLAVGQAGILVPTSSALALAS